MKTPLFLLFALLAFSKATSQSYFIPQYKNTNTERREAQEKAKSAFYRLNESAYELEDKIRKIDSGFSFFIYDEMSEAEKDTLFSKLKRSNSDSEEYFDKSAILKEVKSKKSIDQLITYLKSNKAKINDTFNDLECKEINDYKNTLKVTYTQENFLSKNKKPKKFKVWDAELYDVETINNYFSGQKGVTAFSNFSVQTYSNATYINTELISFYFNYVRLGVSGSLKATNNSEDDAEAIQQDLTTIFQNSGSLNLNFSLPLLFYRNKSEHLHYGVFAETSVGITPNLDSTDKAYFSDDLLVNHQFGLNFKFDVSSSETEDNKKARFFVELPVNYLYGNKKSYQLLDFNDNTSIKLNIGAVLGDLISFRVSGPLFSTTDRIMKIPFLFSINIAPNSISKK